MHARTKVFIVSGLFLAGFAFELSDRHSRGFEAPRARAPRAEAATPSSSDATSSRKRALPSASQRRTDEVEAPQAFSMERVRLLWTSEPALALEEAEVLLDDAERRAERAELRWIMTRSLVSLGRFAEARDLALVMRGESPSSPFTQDVEKHLLVHPLGLHPRAELESAAPEVRR